MFALCLPADDQRYAPLVSQRVRSFLRVSAYVVAILAVGVLGHIAAKHHWYINVEGLRSETPTAIIGFGLICIVIGPSWVRESSWPKRRRRDA
jgi:hypothetical protein